MSVSTATVAMAITVGDCILNEVLEPTEAMSDSRSFSDRVPIWDL